jgi:hypothetical protein
MAKRKPRKQRPFRPEVLDEHADPRLRPRMGPGEAVWRFTITVPVEEIQPRKRPKATPDDLHNLRQMLVRHFGGCTGLPSSFGYGLRDPQAPEQEPEMNYNTYFVVLTSPLPEAEAYFRALKRELETARDEGVILVERQEVWIL